MSYFAASQPGFFEISILAVCVLLIGVDPAEMTPFDVELADSGDEVRAVVASNSSSVSRVKNTRAVAASSEKTEHEIQHIVGIARALSSPTHSMTDASIDAMRRRSARRRSLSARSACEPHLAAQIPINRASRPARKNETAAAN